MALNDIGYFIDLIESFVEGFDYPRFADDLRTFHAVTRCLEIISEASRRISDETKARHRQFNGGKWLPPAISTGTTMRISRSKWFGRPYKMRCLACGSS